MIHFTIDGIEYRSEKLDTFKQLHLQRKIAPLIPKAAPAFLKMLGAVGKLKPLLAQMNEHNKDREKDSLPTLPEGLTGEVDGLADALAPLLEAFAEMEDSRAEFITSTCLSVVQRKQGNTWAPVWGAGGLMFEDIELLAIQQIILKVTWDNLGNFIRGALEKLMPKNKAPE